MPAVRVGWRSVTCHDEFTQRPQESAKRAEKTSKEAAARALPAARAAREQTATRSTEASNAGSSVVCICGSRDRLAPASGRRCRAGIMQPFSAVSVSLLAPREIVFSARCGARRPQSPTPRLRQATGLARVVTGGDDRLLTARETAGLEICGWRDARSRSAWRQHTREPAIRFSGPFHEFGALVSLDQRVPQIEQGILTTLSRACCDGKIRRPSGIEQCHVCEVSSAGDGIGELEP
jgi:hypothetical protein